jgi:hypothetical protein
MAEDRSYIDANTRERERMRALVEALDDDALSAPVNEYWTVAGVRGHIAYWDIRVLVLAEKIDRGANRVGRRRARWRLPQRLDPSADPRDPDRLWREPGLRVKR